MIFNTIAIARALCAAQIKIKMPFEKNPVSKRPSLKFFLNDTGQQQKRRCSPL